MTYINTSADRHSWERINLPAFARDLAAELGGEIIPAREDKFPSDDYAWQSIKLNAAEVLNLSANHSKGRVTVRIWATDVPHQDRNTYDKSHRTSDATVNPDGRSIKAVAKDIKRRVIDASQEALKNQRTFAAEMAGQRNGFARRVAEIREAVPGIRIREDGDRCVYLCDPHCGARLDTSGITIERIYANVDQYLRIRAILSEKKEAAA